jgi:hypothetical protein
MVPVGRWFNVAFRDADSFHEPATIGENLSD